MKVQKFKKILEFLPDDMEVIVKGNEGNYTIDRNKNIITIY